MKEKILLFSLTLLLLNNLKGQTYNGPIPPITSGYGSFGSNGVTKDSITNSLDSNKHVTIFYPTGTTTPVPTIFFCHGYLVEDYNNHIALLEFVASKGYAIVYSPYPAPLLEIFIDHAYNIMLQGFIDSKNSFSSIIDTTRVGIMGHSFGAGGSPWIAKKLFQENGWGANGKFLFINAPWFSKKTTDADLNTFPSDCKFICQVNEQDSVNDHRMAIDLFCNINIPISEKDFIVVPKDSVLGYKYESTHSLWGQTDLYPGTGADYDALDYYALFRLLDALMLYTFNGDLIAKNTALGGGHIDQITMATLNPLIVSDSPIPMHPETYYGSWPCHTTTSWFGANPRVSHCNDVCSTIGINLNEINDIISLYPNPTKGNITIEINTNYSNVDISIFNIFGRTVLQQNSNNKENIQIDLNCESGVYFITIKSNNEFIYSGKIIKE